MRESEKAEAMRENRTEAAIIRMYDALLTVTVWVQGAADRAQVALSDRRNAIALRVWETRSTQHANWPECPDYEGVPERGGPCWTCQGVVGRCALGSGSDSEPKP